MRNRFSCTGMSNCQRLQSESEGKEIYLLFAMVALSCAVRRVPVLLPLPPCRPPLTKRLILKSKSSKLCLPQRAHSGFIHFVRLSCESLISPAFSAVMTLSNPSQRIKQPRTTPCIVLSRNGECQPAPLVHILFPVYLSRLLLPVSSPTVGTLPVSPRAPPFSQFGTSCLQLSLPHTAF